MELAPAVSGILLEDNGQPATDVFVMARDPESWRPMSAAVPVEENGSFVLPCKEVGLVALTARRRKSMIELEVGIFACPLRDVVLRLPDSAAGQGLVRGRVVDAHGPVVSQHLYVVTESGRRRPVDVTQQETGEFQFHAPPGVYRICTRRNDREVFLASCIVPVGGGEIVVGDLHLPE